jgi:AraC-like DNA-binding protein
MYDSKNVIVHYFEKETGDKFLFKKEHSYFFFLIKGKVKYSFEKQVGKTLDAGTFLLIPQECDCVIEAEEHSEIVMLKMHHKINFCDHFPLEILHELNKDIEPTENSLHVLKVNEVISDWLKNVVKTTVGGLKCTYFQELKQKEMLFYLRAYYSKEDLHAFFSPILNSDVRFSNLIYKSYQTVENINELAELTSYSLSGIKKKFMRIFGCSPAMWIEREKAKKIYHEINCTLKPFKEIANEYNFSSATHFDRFCKRMYNMSPGVLRKNTKHRILYNIEN